MKFILLLVSILSTGCKTVSFGEAVYPGTATTYAIECQSPELIHPKGVFFSFDDYVTIQFLTKRCETINPHKPCLKRVTKINKSPYLTFQCAG
jgi:hypothetical protein